MRKLFLLLLITPFFAHGQHAVIHFHVKNAVTKTIKIIKDDYTNPDILFEKDEETFVSLVDGKASWTGRLSSPRFVTAYYEDSVARRYHSYVFYVSPGDNLDFSFDGAIPEETYAVKGKGSKNNQPSIQQLHHGLNLSLYQNDTVPDRVWKAIKERSRSNDRRLIEYVSRNRPGRDFENVYALRARYFPLWMYAPFKGNQKYIVSDSEAYDRNEQAWQKLEDSLVHAVSLNDLQILRINEFGHFLSVHLTRIKEQLWEHPELLQDYYGTRTQEEAVALRNDDPHNLLKEKIIQKRFTGQTAEFLYAVLFKDAFGDTEDNLPEIFSRFKATYPQSAYIPYIEPSILAIEERSKRTLTDKMVFVENESYKSFDDLLKLVKGKTVLLDMWGTWCGPCRAEILANSEPIKDHFKGKPLEYLYVANHDIGKDKKWKELIAFYDLTGTHVLASPQLTRDIMQKLRSDSYPTYVIIKSDGTFVLSEAGYPMDRKILIDQLEKALAN